MSTLSATQLGHTGKRMDVQQGELLSEPCVIQDTSRNQTCIVFWMLTMCLIVSAAWFTKSRTSKGKTEKADAATTRKSAEKVKLISAHRCGGRQPRRPDLRLRRLQRILKTIKKRSRNEREKSLEEEKRSEPQKEEEKPKEKVRQEETQNKRQQRERKGRKAKRKGLLWWIALAAMNSRPIAAHNENIVSENRAMTIKAVDNLLRTQKVEETEDIEATQRKAFGTEKKMKRQVINLISANIHSLRPRIPNRHHRGMGS